MNGKNSNVQTPAAPMNALPGGDDLKNGAIKMALCAKEKLGFIDGRMVEPELWDPTFDSLEQEFFKKAQRQKLIQFLPGLSSKYDVIKHQILMMDP
ncbi:hypothetical protein LIER_25931 [Lithospermum erythrorhizon]|uniref:Uncharacterized protein n=1 Tax=Lithospermum erythrorhizon TaxID=34254 RepID=A0AAV3R9N1_LITER